MVLQARGTTTSHNAMLGRRVPHPASTKFHDDDNEAAPKRLKIFESTDGEDSRSVSDDEDTLQSESYRDEVPDSEDEEALQGEGKLIPSRPTELESALPQIKTDKEAIEEYEAMRAAEDIPEDLKVRLTQRSWTKGKSSIYVDAFNLALETVLDDEGHLFDEKETEVFKQWRELEYEAQYL